MTIKNRPASPVGHGLYNFDLTSEQFVKGLTNQGHLADVVEFQAAAMTVISVLHKVRTAYEFGRGMSTDDFHTCRQAAINLLFDIYRMEAPEVAA